jgi:hypothetical protein
MVVSYRIPTHHQLSCVLQPNHTGMLYFCTKNMIVHACQKTQWTQNFLNSYKRAKKTEFKYGQTPSFKERCGMYLCLVMRLQKVFDIEKGYSFLYFSRPIGQKSLE